ncbi:MAG: hypothetical protein JSW09_04825 [Pseudomonadota bacterium]|nr:MAG: hypothetical protein JSW09_04825 [Pseudomonadota bacterium]
MDVEYYAQRLLNPFRGVMHTLRYRSAEAVTVDGVRWDIYVANDLLRHGLDNQRRAQISDIRYGSWSAEQGLKRGPLYPSDDFRRMEAMGATVYENLLRVHQNVPFPFRDSYELWSLDGEQRPLALLHSVVNAEEMETDIAIHWRPGYAAMEEFVSRAAREINPAVPAAQCLERYIAARTGGQASAQWFRRVEDGGGIGLQCIKCSPALRERELPASSFPSLFLAQANAHPVHRRLIDDFHTWQAPWLLTLPTLAPTTRRRLEQCARQRPFVVESQYRLYPEIIDASAVQAALVEAMLRRSQPALDARKDDTLPTYYIELDTYSHDSSD